MQLWVSSTEAQELTNQAMEKGDPYLADRFYRVARSAGLPWLSWLPPIRTWQEKHPLLVQCVYCEQWAGFQRHRDVRRSGWRRESGSWGPWLHADCVESWLQEREALREARAAARSRRDSEQYLLGHPEMLSRHNGVLVRDAPYYEHTAYGVLDPDEGQINADFGMERLLKLIDGMPDALRSHLVVAAFIGYHGHYNMLLGWAGSVPADYDGVEFDDVLCQSIVLDHVPEKIRRDLPRVIREVL